MIRQNLKQDTKGFHGVLPIWETSIDGVEKAKNQERSKGFQIHKHEVLTEQTHIFATVNIRFRQALDVRFADVVDSFNKMNPSK